MIQEKILVAKGSDNFLSTVNTMTAQTVSIVPRQCKNARDIKTAWPNYDSSIFMKLKTNNTTVETYSSRQAPIWGPWLLLYLISDIISDNEISRGRWWTYRAHHHHELCMVRPGLPSQAKQLALQSVRNNDFLGGEGGGEVGDAWRLLPGTVVCVSQIDNANLLGACF